MNVSQSLLKHDLPVGYIVRGKIIYISPQILDELSNLLSILLGQEKICIMSREWGGSGDNQLHYFSLSYLACRKRPWQGLHTCWGLFCILLSLERLLNNKGLINMQEFPCLAWNFMVINCEVIYVV
jgi:hypothetical protein